MVWPPPSVPIFSSMSADGSLPSLVRNGPGGRDPQGLVEPRATLHLDRRVDASGSALLMELLNALSSRLWTSSWSFPPPQEASASAAKSRQEHGAAHAPQSSWRHRNSVRLGALFRRMGYVKRTALIAAVVMTARCGRSGARRDGDRGGRQTRPAGERSRRCPTRAEIAPARSRARAGPGAARRAWPAPRRSGAAARSTPPSAGSCARKHIKRSQYRRWRATYVRSARTLRRLRGARGGPAALRAHLGRVAGAAAAADRRRRMPAVFLQLERNRQYWPRMPYPAAGDQVSFRGSELLFQYFAGEGLQLHPLSTFKKANHLHGFCEREEPSCDEAALRAHPRRDDRARGEARPQLHRLGVPLLLRRRRAAVDERDGAGHRHPGARPRRAAAERARSTPTPPAARWARSRPPRPPACAPPARAAGSRYLQYSFAPRLYIFNAFLQSLIGLYDFSNAHRRRARARGLYDDAEPEARAEVPLQRRGRLVALQLRRPRVESRTTTSCCASSSRACASRRLGAVYCELREEVPRLPGRPAGGELRGAGEPPRRTSRSRCASACRSCRPCEVTVTRPDGSVVFDRLATFRRGTGSFTWTPRGAVHVHRAGGGEGAAHRPRQARQRHAPRSRWRTGPAERALGCAAR